MVGVRRDSLVDTQLGRPPAAGALPAIGAMASRKDDLMTAYDHSKFIRMGGGAYNSFSGVPATSKILSADQVRQLEILAAMGDNDAIVALKRHLQQAGVL